MPIKALVVTKRRGQEAGEWVPTGPGKQPGPGRWVHEELFLKKWGENSGNKRTILK